MDIIRKGKLLSEDEHLAFIDLVGRKKSIDTNLIPHLKTSNEFKHLFMVSGTRLQLEHDRNIFSKMIRSMRQKHNGSDIPAFKFNPRTKKYDSITKITYYLDAITIKFLKSAINSLRDRPGLQEQCKDILSKIG